MILKTKMEKIINSSYSNIGGIIVLKNGKTLYENYFNECTVTSTFHVFSVTKSIISILIGIAIDKGYIKSINQKVLDFFPDYAVKNCRKIRKNTKWLNITNIKICEHNFINIPYGNDFFDAVICTSRIHHAIINDIKKVVSEIYRVLNQKGYFIFDMISKEDEFLKVQKQINTNNI